MKAGAFTDETVDQVSDGFVAIMVDIDADKQTPDDYGIKFIPDVRFLKSDGTLISKMEARDAEGVANAMRAALDKAK